MEQFSGYHRPDWPAGSYAALMALFNGLLAGFLVLVKRSGRELPEEVKLRDVLLLGVATHKLSRVIAKESITSAVRAPFTEYQRPAGAAEVVERPRGSGWRHAIGELISCPFCTGHWVAAGLTYGLVLAPRVTRLIASLFAAVALADVLQLLYESAKKWAS